MSKSLRGTCFSTGLLCLFLLFNSISFANSNATESLKPAVKATRVGEQLKIDGFLNEKSWSKVPFQNGFTQRFPFVGQKSSQQTSFKVLFDDRYLYLGIRCHETDPNLIITRTKRFDSSRFFSDDYVAVKIDPNLDQKTVYYFAVSANGTYLDAKSINNGAQFLKEWDTSWSVEAIIDDKGWQAEFKIPFTSIEYSGEKNNPLGFNITRNIERIPEESDWSEIPPPFGGLQASYYGLLTGIEIKPVSWQRLLIFPFIAVGGEEDLTAATGDSSDDIDLIREPGIDFKYPLTRSAVLQGTVNTDFSQVAIDAAQVNLTRFPLFFAEQRPFFLEGAQYFDFGISTEVQPFYSRRIGIDSSGSAVPIRGGVRSYGSANRFEYGLLNMQTGDTAAVSRENFSVGRFRQYFFKNSEFGGIISHRQDTDSPGRHNTAFGFDTYLRTADNRLTFDGWYSGTISSPDLNLDPEAKEGFGSAFQLHPVWTPGLWRAAAALTYVDGKYNPEMGFLKRQEIFRPAFSLSRSIRMANRGINELKISTYQELVFEDNAQKLNDYYSDLFFKLRLNSDFYFEAGLKYQSLAVIEPFSLANEATVPVGQYHNTQLVLFAETPWKYNLVGKLRYTLGSYYQGFSHKFSPQIVLRPLPTLFLNCYANVSQVNISSLGADFVTTDFNFSGNYSLTKKMYIDLNLSWNHADNSINLQYLYRLRFRPLSDFYIVYGEERKASDFSSNARSIIFKLVFYFSS